MEYTLFSVLILIITILSISLLAITIKMEQQQKNSKDVKTKTMDIEDIVKTNNCKAKEFRKLYGKGMFNAAFVVGAFQYYIGGHLGEHYLSGKYDSVSPKFLVKAFKRQ